MNVSEGVELTTAEVAQSNNEAEPRGRTGRPDETNGTSASDGSTAEDDSEVPVQPEDNGRAATNDAAEEWKTTLHGR